MTDKTWYMCDPKKNTKCRKTSCGWCRLTSDKESAQLSENGKPIRVNITRVDGGFREEIVEERKE